MTVSVRRGTSVVFFSVFFRRYWVIVGDIMGGWLGWVGEGKGEVEEGRVY